MNSRLNLLQLKNPQEPGFTKMAEHCFVVDWDVFGAVPFCISAFRHSMHQHLRGRHWQAHLGVALVAFRMWLIAVDGC